MLRIESVSKRFRSGNYGAREVSLTARGGVLGLLGPNGAGKTTLMQMIATVTRPTAGRIFFQDIDVLADPDALRQRLGYLPQDFGVYENLTASEFLSYFAALKGVREKKKITEMLEMVNLHHVANRAVGGFSGGMKQRLGIAQALINDPDLVIVDEPTEGLAPRMVELVRDLLTRIAASGVAILLIEQRLAIALDIADRLYVMGHGRIVFDGTPDALRAAPTVRGEWLEV
jgi:ABC-type multidrug transport system ATPase subunit